jgi:hypothetical protein
MMVHSNNTPPHPTHTCAQLLACLDRSHWIHACDICRPKRSVNDAVYCGQKLTHCLVDEDPSEFGKRRTENWRRRCSVARDSQPVLDKRMWRNVDLRNRDQERTHGKWREGAQTWRTIQVTIILVSVAHVVYSSVPQRCERV